MKGQTEKIIIIGGGIAGLAAGIYARLSGFDVEIYEKNAIAGGECIGWNREGYHIDNCIHWLTGTKEGTSLYDVWKTVGAITNSTEYAKIDAFYSSTYMGQTATLWNDLERTENELIEISPEDTEEIRKFIEYVKYSKQCLIPAEKPMDMWGIKDYAQIGATMKDMPKVTKEYGKISLEEFGKRFKHPLLQKLMTDYLPKSYTTYSFFVSYATIASGNGGIPLGASLQMSLRMERKFIELGGKIYKNQTVEKIIIAGKKITGVVVGNGICNTADYYISSVDADVLFHKLLPEKYLPNELKMAYNNPQSYPGTSGFQIAYTVPCTSMNYETIFMDIDPIRIGDKTFERMYVKYYGYDDLFIKDGKMVLQTCINQTDDDYAYWKSLSNLEYAKEKNRLVKEITERILSNFPELADELHYLDAWTPLTYERYCGAYHGSYMSFVTTPGAKQVKLNGQVKGINNLFIAGQWVNAPGGLPVAVTSGKFAIQRILKKEKKNINI